VNVVLDEGESASQPADRAAAGRLVSRTFRIDLAWDGEAFCGWQRQASDRTVQATVEDALARIVGERTPVVGAGRTDAGVHALQGVASFSAATRLSAEAIARALDATLPDDVGVLAVAEKPGFHALRDARWKWYRYTWVRARLRRVHDRRTAWQVGERLDVAAMAAAAASLRGTHDFAAFQSSGSPRASTVRTLAGVALVDDPPAIRLDAVADGFLYGMMRAIAGTLHEVGRGVRPASSLSALIASGDRRAAGPAAPARGLTLVAVGFDGDAPPPFVDPALSPRLFARGESAGPAPERTPAPSKRAATRGVP
jgi:tRNA pseudouridine38-40 synthase